MMSHLLLYDEKLMCKFYRLFKCIKKRNQKVSGISF